MPITASLARLALAAAALLALPALSSADTGTFANNDGITIPDTSVATPYPSSITVSGLTGRITDVNAGIAGFTHTAATDVRILLRAPSGDGLLLLDAPSCGGNISAVDMSFDDGAASGPTGICATGSFRPNGASTALPGSGGTGNAGTLARFRGQDPNGTWTLYVQDFLSGDSGSLTGWSLEITTDTGAILRFPASGSTGAASSYPIAIDAPAIPAGEVISSMTVTLTGLEHSAPEDLDMLLAAPGGRAIPLMSDVCGQTDLVGNLIFTDIAGSALGTGPCSTGTFRPTDLAAGDSWPAPAPAPTGTTFAEFDRTAPRDAWGLYVVDDTSLGTGVLAGATISTTTTPARPLFFFSDVTLATEGTPATVRVARLGTPSGPATVDYTTVAGTAQPGADYTATAGTLTFARGELTKRIQVPIVSDAVAEGQENLIVRLSNPTDDAVIDGSTDARIEISASEGTTPTTPAPEPSTPAPRTPAAPCAALKGTAKATCLRRQKAADARAACLKRYPRAGARRTACLRTAAKLALPPGRR